MARNLVHRIESLEGDPGRLPGKDPCALTVDLRASFKAIDFRVLGFSLEELDGTSVPGVPRICADGIDFNFVLKNTKRRSALVAQLQRLDPARRAKLAAKHGFKVVYPAPTGAPDRG